MDVAFHIKSHYLSILIVEILIGVRGDDRWQYARASTSRILPSFEEIILSTVVYTDREEGRFRYSR